MLLYKHSAFFYCYFLFCLFFILYYIFFQETRLIQLSENGDEEATEKLKEVKAKVSHLKIRAILYLRSHFWVSSITRKIVTKGKNLCISCTFLLKYWAQNHMRPLILSMGLLNSRLGTSFSPIIELVLVSRLPFVNYCVLTKQMFFCDWAALDFLSNFNFFTWTVGLSNEDNCCQLQEYKKWIKDMLSKGILSIRFWQVCHK